MRDKLIYAYFAIDYTLVWDTVKDLKKNEEIIHNTQLIT